MPRRPALAVSLNLVGRRCLVVGDGEGAAERASRLRAAGADLREVSVASYGTDMCDDVFLVVAETGNAERDRRIAADARAARALSYAHDQPAWSDFVFPALARRGPITVAITTDSAAPALSRRLREELQAALDEAGDGVDRLVSEMEREREARPPGDLRAAHLRRMAERLRLRGRFDVG
ncbi:MAG TPA: NAD(P)-dependent oxidoreductase [Kofleriaceae bacterium]|nr:NAD(P)-dependent oxidoreductase [Kofleriaceae bacterium]